VDEDLAAAATLRADIRCGARLGTGTMAHGAHGVGGEAHARRDAVHGLEEVEGQLGLEVGAPLGAGLAPAPTPPSAGTASQQPAEQVAHPRALVELEGPKTFGATGAEAPGTAEAAAPERPDARGHHLADLVVLLALGGVAEDVVGGRHRLELL